MQLLQALIVEFTKAADQTIAAQQSAYMRNLFTFHGIKKPRRALIQKALIKEYPLSSEEELIELLHLLWSKPEREYQYAALDIAYRYRKVWTPSMLVTYEQLIRTKSWWDTVDSLGSKLVGTLVKEYTLHTAMDEWIDHKNMWIRRSALIYQLSYKDQTDQSRLFNYCAKRMHEQEFFIRKAIGWALRNYSRTNQKVVREFIDEKRHILSSLSYREAAKYC